MAKRKPRVQKTLPGMTPKQEAAMQRKVLQIVEVKREIAELREEQAGHEGSLAELMRGAKLLTFRHQGYVATMSETTKLKVKAEGGGAA